MTATTIRALAAALLLIASGCRIGGDVQPIPLRGPMPESIAVWPMLAGAAAAGFGPVLLEGLDRAILRAGYTVVSHEVAWAILEGHAPDEPSPSTDIGENDPAALGRRLHVDAILVLEARRFEIDAPDRLRSASWDLRWTLQSTRGHGVLWSFEHNGTWRPSPDDEDPHRPLDAEPGPAWLGIDRPPHFRDVRELSFWLHRHAMEHLPAGSR